MSGSESEWGWELGSETLTGEQLKRWESRKVKLYESVEEFLADEKICTEDSSSDEDMEAKQDWSDLTDEQKTLLGKYPWWGKDSISGKYYMGRTTTSLLRAKFALDEVERKAKEQAEEEKKAKEQAEEEEKKAKEEGKAKEEEDEVLQEGKPNKKKEIFED